MMNKQGTIYKIENLVNGKVYVGQTIRDVDRRLQCHLVKLRGNYHNNNYFQNAFNKYGEGNFETSIIEKCNVEQIDNREVYWINYYKNSVGVYNIEGGGNYHKIVTTETRKKLSMKSKSSWLNDEIRNKRLRGLKYGKDNPNSRVVICVTDGKIFESMTKAAEHYDICMKTIYDVVIGRTPYCYTNGRKDRLEFCYYEKGKIYKPKKHTHKLSIGVKCITTGEVFDCIARASEKYNIPTTNISKVCKGQRKHAGRLPDGTKLKWEYAD